MSRGIKPAAMRGWQIKISRGHTDIRCFPTHISQRVACLLYHFYLAKWPEMNGLQNSARLPLNNSTSCPTNATVKYFLKKTWRKTHTT